MFVSLKNVEILGKIYFREINLRKNFNFQIACHTHLKKNQFKVLIFLFCEIDESLILMRISYNTNMCCNKSKRVIAICFNNTFWRSEHVNLSNLIKQYNFYKSFRYTENLS